MDPNGPALDDLFGDMTEEMTEPVIPPQNDIDDEHDFPHQAMSGMLPLPPLPASNPAEYSSMNDPPAMMGDDDEDLFGDAEIAAEEDELTAEERERRRALEYEEEDVPPYFQPKEERVAQLPFAAFPIPRAGKVWHAKLPNFLAIESIPFVASSWQIPVEQEGEYVRKGPSGDIPDENVIRWNWSINDTGTIRRGANSRIVRWSDGSLSMQVGSELFDITASVDHSADLAPSTDTAAGDVKPSLHASGPTTGLSSMDANRSHSLTYLVVLHDYLEIMEAQASIYGTMTFRPTTLQSNTHKRIVGSIAGRYVKERGIKLAMVDEDPERKKAEREKLELEKARKAKREANKEASTRKSRKARFRDFNFSGFSDDEGEQDEGDVGEEGGDGYERRTNPKRGRGGPLSRNQDDDDGFIVNDSDEDEDAEGEEDGRPANKRSRSEGEEDAPMDEMEEAEARIEREERRRKERMREKADTNESESVTTAAPTQAPRRRLVIEDEDED